MNTSLPKDPQFNKYYRKHQKFLKLKGLQPKTIEAYSRAIRRIGNYFHCRISNLTSDQLLDYFNELLDSHSWSAVKLDLYGLNCENGHVTFRYLHAKTGQYRTRTVTGEYFLYLLMLHVLPKGFRRARCYGFLHPCSKPRWNFAQGIEPCAKKWKKTLFTIPVLPHGAFLRGKKLIRFLQVVLRVHPLSMFIRKLKKRPTITCPVCGARMEIIRTMTPKPQARQAACLT